MRQFSPKPSPLGFFSGCALLACALPSLAVDLNITDFGAVSGGGNDWVAIQQAVNAASAGDRVVIPAGVFQISSAITPQAGVAIVGTGREQSVIEFIGASNSPMIRLNGSAQNDIEISGFTLDGNNSDRATHGILAEFSSGHHIHNMGFRDFVETSDFGSHAIHFRNDVDNTRVESNHFRNIGLNDNFGSAIRISRGSQFNVIAGNDISHTGRGGIFAEIGSTDNVIRGNTVMNSGLFDNDNGAGLAIELWNGSGRTIVEDNVVDTWLSVDRSDRVAVRRNRVVSEPGGNLKFTQLELAGGADNVFTDNELGPGAKIGFSLSSQTTAIEPGGFGSLNIERLFIGRNQIREGANQNVQFNSGGSTIRQVYLYDNDITDGDSQQQGPNDGIPSGLRIIGNDNKQYVLESNMISNNANVGVRFSFNTSQVTDGINEFAFIDNRIENNDGPAFSGTFQMTNIDFGPSNTVAGNSNNNTPNDTGFTNAAPLVGILVNQTTEEVFVRPGDAINFGLAYADDGAAASPSDVLWDLDDGLPVVEPMPTYAYDAPGAYTVTLLAWDPTGRAARDSTLVTVVADLAGDYNDDGTVDASDYTFWRDAAGVATTLANRNPGEQGVVGLRDYEIWRFNYGASWEANGVTVPEPATGLLAIGLLAATLLTRRSPC